MPPEIPGTPTPAQTPVAPSVAADPAKAAPAAAADPGAQTQAAAEAPKEDTRVSKRFAALSKREREIQLEREKIKLEREELAAARAKNQSLEEELDKDPLGALQKRGKSYADLTKRLLNEGKKTPEQEIAELRAKLEAQEEAREQEKLEAQKRDLEERQANFKTTIKETLSSNPDRFEFTLAEGEDGIAVVYNVMAEHWSKHKKMLTVEEAAEQVEKHIEELIDSRYVKLKKVQAKFAPKKEPEPAKKETPAAAAPESPKTLSNSMSSGGPAPSGRSLSNEESLAEAAKLIKWTTE